MKHRGVIDSTLPDSLPPAPTTPVLERVSTLTTRSIFSASLAPLIALIVLLNVFSHGDAATIHSRFDPRFTLLPAHSIDGTKASTDNTLTTWTSTFIDNGLSYSYTMVGTNPASLSQTASIPVLIVPINVLIDHALYSGSSQVSGVLASPLFQNASFATGTTQYTDAIQRASFWNVVHTTNPDYHVLLATPTIALPYTITVSAKHGSTILVNNHAYGNISNLHWWDTKMQALLTTYKTSPNELVIFLTNDVILENGVGGYHSATGSSGSQTYIWASIYDQYLFRGFTDEGALSHELAEWLDDPYGNNIVPTWSVPNQPQYGCQDVLEVGDPLVGTVFTLNNHTLQDEALFAWFARQTPSSAYNASYSYLGTLTSASTSTGCPSVQDQSNDSTGSPPAQSTTTYGLIELIAKPPLTSMARF